MSHRPVRPTSQPAKQPSSISSIHLSVRFRLFLTLRLSRIVRLLFRPSAHPFLYKYAGVHLRQKDKKFFVCLFFRSIKKLKTALPSSPKERTACLSAYVDKRRVTLSAGVQTFDVSLPVSLSVEEAAIDNIRELVESVKHQRSNGIRITMFVFEICDQRRKC